MLYWIILFKNDNNYCFNINIICNMLFYFKCFNKILISKIKWFTIIYNYYILYQFKKNKLYKFILYL